MKRVNLKNRHNGFTLVELLVVIGIIATLAAMLFPTLVQAKSKVGQSICASNMRQLGSAWSMYTEDYDGQFPSHAQMGAEGGWNWFDNYPANQEPNHFDVSQGTLYAYAKKSRIFVCPNDAEGGQSGGSYSVNSCLYTGMVMAGANGGMLYVAKSGSMLENSSGMMLFGEEAAKRVKGANKPELNSSSTDDGLLWFNVNGVNSFSARHAGGSNLCYLDGHVKWQKVSKFGQLDSTRYQTGNASPDTCPWWN